jgi:fatty-acyl-CoA synthase
MTPVSGTLDSLSFEALSPVAFLERSARVFPDRLAVVSDGLRFTYAEHWDRAQRQAGLWHSVGIRPGDRVAVLSPNTHVLLESHVGVPLAGGVLVALNTRLKPGEIAGILEHSGARVLLVDGELESVARKATAAMVPRVLVIVAGEDYEERLMRSSAVRVHLEDERALLAINYTSGTTGSPKGVMYHHRGAYLQALAMALHARLDLDSRYLWTLPMFHTNGWCFPWAVTAAGGVHVCLRRPDADAVWHAIAEEGVTHLCAAPTVLSSMEAHPGRPTHAPREILAMTGGAPPTPSLLERFDDLGVRIVHLYGLTETFGPAVISEWFSEWEDLPAPERAVLRARQGVQNVVSQRVRVVAADGTDVPADGLTQGEIAMRGNNVMLGYYNDPQATAAAAPDGWFRTGDIGVLHPRGVVEIRDRVKDVIISGGENIASVEVERALATHPAILEVAVIGRPDEKWGEVPVGYVTVREGFDVGEAELIAHVRGLLANFKAPKSITFGDLPHTSTGKIQKNLLRESTITVE